MEKIIGFLITEDDNLPEIDFFHSNLNKILIKKGKFNIFLWGIGNIDNCSIDNKYSLSFPLSLDLLDRNILLSFENDKIIIENDWLGSIPVFYNSKYKIVSTISVFCLKDKKINNEGLKNFCEFGYSVFENTMFNEIDFMRYFSKIIIDDDLSIEYKDDPIVKLFSEKEMDENNVISFIQKNISDIENKFDGDIILPISGGYDTRLLSFLIHDKSRIRSFTYGTSKKQNQSFEVVNAKKISEIYKINWNHVELSDFNKYIDVWFKIYGFSAHLHGMYQVEFYDNIFKKNKFKNPFFLSGIVGDIWAGSIKYSDLIDFDDVLDLGYSHGISIPLKFLKIKGNEEKLKKKFFQDNIKFLENDKFKSIFTVRMKIILLSYLLQIPEYFGVPAWTPFLNFKVVGAILSIDEDRRNDRIWQKDFFDKVGLNLENMNLKSDKSNFLDYEIAKKSHLEPINFNLMEKYISKERLLEINLKLKRISWVEDFFNKLLQTGKIGWILNKIGFKNNYLEVINEYYIIKTIEKSIQYES